MFNTFDTSIKDKLKVEDCTYNGGKPNPTDWADLIESDPIFNEEFNKIFNNVKIQEADDYTPEVLEDTYLNMELALSRDDDGPKYAKVCKKTQRGQWITYWYCS